MNSSSENLESRSDKDILDIVGGNGPWQRRILLIMFIGLITGAMHNFSVTFLAPDLDYWCAKPPHIENMTLEQWRSDWLPPGDKKKCYRYENYTFEHTLYEDARAENIYRIVACDSWNYNNSIYTSTIVNKWNLVCNRKWLVSLSKSIFMFGFLVGSFVCGCVSDKLGRRLTISICSFLVVSFGFICAFSVYFPVFCIARFIIAVGVSGYYTSFFVLLMEVTDPKMHSVYGLGVDTGWCTGYICLPAIAWMVRDWLWLQIAITVPFIGLLGIWWIIPESPRWLLTQGKIEEARKVLRTAAKANNIDLSSLDSKLANVMEEATKAHEAGETEGNVLDLFMFPGLCKITINVFFMWFVNGIVYYGISLNTNELKGDPFITFALSGVVELPALFLSVFAMNRLGCRIPIAASMIAGGLTCTLAYPLPEGWATVVVSMIGKFFITGSLAMVHVYTTELFPTVVRNAALGSGSLCEGIGSIVASFSKELGVATHPVFPLLVIGILSVASGVLVLLLPETHNCVVTNTLKEAAKTIEEKKGQKIIL